MLGYLSVDISVLRSEQFSSIYGKLLTSRKMFVHIFMPNGVYCLFIPFPNNYTSKIANLRRGTLSRFGSKVSKYSNSVNEFATCQSWFKWVVELKVSKIES